MFYVFFKACLQGIGDQDLQDIFNSYPHILLTKVNFLRFASD